MVEYLEREALIAEFKRLGLGANSLVERLFADGAYTVIEKFPAADVVPVAHAHWERRRNLWYCTNCGKGYKITYGALAASAYNYCPNCGAKMDGGTINAID